MKRRGEGYTHGLWKRMAGQDGRGGGLLRLEEAQRHEERSPKRDETPKKEGKWKTGCPKLKILDYTMKSNEKRCLILREKYQPPITDR